jgi:hypothetical protein
MSNNIVFNIDNNTNEWVNCIGEAITKNYFKYYECNHFYNIKKVGSGRFGEVCRANLRDTDSHKLLALKSFSNFDDITVKEIINEVIILYSKYVFDIL